MIYILVYVDDILITGSSQLAVTSVIRSLGMEFALKDLGDLHYFLGVEAHCVPEGLFLSQHRYIINLLHRTNMTHAKPVASPMSTTHALTMFAGDVFEDETLYRSTVGALQYLSLTRADISFAVNRVCQFMHRPTTVHWTAVKRILRYLKHTVDHGILIRPSHTSQFIAYSDADWAGSPDDRRSTSGYCIFFGHNIVTWSSKKQTTVARSSTEAEYRAIANTTSELIWLQSLCRELGISQPHAPILWCDNIGATYLTANPVFHARTKHIELDYHFVREQVSKKLLDVRFISGKDQVADVLTKPLSSPRFTLLKNKLHVAVAPLCLRGRVRDNTPDQDKYQSEKITPRDIQFVNSNNERDMDK